MSADGDWVVGYRYWVPRGARPPRINRSRGCRTALLLICNRLTRMGGIEPVFEIVPYVSSFDRVSEAFATILWCDWQNIVDLTCTLTTPSPRANHSNGRVSVTRIHQDSSGSRKHKPNETQTLHPLRNPCLLVITMENSTPDNLDLSFSNISMI